MGFNESFVTEVVVGTVLSPTGRVKTSRGHVLFNPKKTVIQWIVFMFMEPEKICCLRTENTDNGERLSWELGQCQRSAPCWARGSERTRTLFDENKILGKKLRQLYYMFTSFFTMTWKRFISNGGFKMCHPNPVNFSQSPTLPLKNSGT